MNKFIKKIVAGVLTLTIGLSFNATAFAESIGSVASDPSVGKDEAQGVVTEYQEFTPAYESTTTGTDVYLTNDTENVVVSVPKKVILSGTYDPVDKKYKGEYTVKVEGDFAGHKVVKVVPDNTVDLIQQGKKNITANITQDKTDFIVKDVTDNTNIGNGLIEAEHLTAGSWKGVFNFNVSLNEYRYYSTLDKAVNDANNLTTLNSDVKDKDVQNAVAAMYIENDNSNANIYLLKDSNNTPNLNLTKNTNIELNDNNVNFNNKCGLSANSNLVIENGTINSTDSEYMVKQSNTETALTLNNLVLNNNRTAESNTNAYTIQSLGINNDFSNVTSNVNGVPTDGKIISLALNNDRSITNLNNVKADMQVESAKTSIRGLDIVSHKAIVNEIDINCALTGTATQYEGVNIGPNSDITINGANIIGAIGKKGDGRGTGISCVQQANTNLTVNSTEEHPVYVFGNSWAISTGYNDSRDTEIRTNINGGVYKSYNHTGYFAANAEIHDATFECLGDGYGFYCGGSWKGEPNNNHIVNIYNTKIIAPYSKGITATWNLGNYGYFGQKEINLYDCEIYAGDGPVFHYNFLNDKDNRRCNTEFHLYGNTKLYNGPEKREVTKDVLDNAINTWKTTKVTDKVPVTKWEIYNYSVADTNNIISGSAKYNVNDGTFVCWNTPEGNVYDHRTLG